MKLICEKNQKLKISCQNSFKDDVAFIFLLGVSFMRRINHEICLKFWLRSKLDDFKGSLTREFRLQVFFHKSVSPGPLSIPLGPFRIFSKIRGDNRKWMFITGVNDTGNKWKKFWGIIFFYFLLRATLSAHYTYRLNYCLFFIFRCKQANIGKTL